MTDQDKRDTDALLAALDETNKALEHGEAIYRKLTTGFRRMKAALWVAIVGLIADLALSTAFGVILHNQSSLNDRVSANQVNIKQVECDLNDVFIKADTVEARDRSPNKAQYDAAFHSIYQSRVQLGCQPAVTEPIRPPS